MGYIGREDVVEMVRGAKLPCVLHLADVRELIVHGLGNQPLP